MRIEGELKMSKSILIELSKKFAIDIVNLCRKVKEESKETILTSQLLRSGTSIGANLHEGNYASSRLDFINKFQISLKECYETEYWLSILAETKYITQEEYSAYYGECSKLRKLLTSSIITAKKNGDGNQN